MCLTAVGFADSANYAKRRNLAGEVIKMRRRIVMAAPGQTVTLR
jgi:hypothetical protein